MSDDTTSMFPTAIVRTHWQVEIFKGATGIDITNAPVKFGTTTITVGGDAPVSDLFEPLIYGPVGLRSVDDWLCIEVPIELTQAEYKRQLTENGSVSIGTRIVREMSHVHKVDFDNWGSIRVTGLEERPDGSAVFAIWTVEIYQPD